MSQEEKRSRPIYRKYPLPFGDRDDYALDIYEGDLPPLSEGDSYILRDRAGLYNLAIIRKEDKDHKCDKDHHYCQTHKRCERDDHDCDDKPSGGGGDSDTDRKTLEEVRDNAELLRKILRDVQDSDNDSDRAVVLDRKILSVVLNLTNICNTILSTIRSTPPPPPIPIPPAPSPSPSPSPSPPPPAPIPPPPPPPQQSHTRVIITGEVDVPHPEITEEDKPEDPVFQDKLARQVVDKMKKTRPDFKITKVLVARGAGPVAVPW